MDPIGIMQGRLSPPVDGAIQLFPLDTWEQEFALARKADLSCIEWIYDRVTEAGNPLASDAGVNRIHELSGEHGIEVRSICADYYMEDRLMGESGAPSEGAAKHLRWLVSRADLLGARYIVLPFVDSSSIRTGEGIRTLTGMLSTFIPYLEEVGVELHLETDLLPEILGGVLGSINHPLIRANYDSGNSAALGYAPGYELGLIGKWVSSVHVKDRLLGGGSVPLGTGAADFPACFAMLRNSGFHGLYILQAARDPTMSELDLAIRNRGFVERYLMNR